MFVVNGQRYTDTMLLPWFDHIQIDLVGPLPPSNGCTYLLTCVDHFTRWLEAIPIPDSTADKDFIQTWISRFGVPSTVTTDRGRQFESHLWKALANLLGTQHARTTAYHPIANGLVERFHRQLKSALKASPHPDRWTDMLHMVLLGIRTSLKEDLKCTAAKLVYGTSLRLPGEFFVSHNTDPSSYVTHLKQAMQVLRCTPTRKPSHSSHMMDNSLHSTSHVFVRHDAVRKPLQQPYDGPYLVLDRSAKFFTVDIKGRKDTVSIDRLKPAYLDDSVTVDIPTVVAPSSDAPANAAPAPASATSSTPQPSTKPERTTRSGRRVHWPAHRRDFAP